MKFALIATIAATVAAEENFTCTQTATEWTPSTEVAITGAVKDAATCGAACTTKATEGAQKTIDYCCFYVSTVDSAADTTDVLTCSLWSKTAVTDDIKNVKVAKAAVTDGTKKTIYTAWAWNAGVELTTEKAATDATTTAAVATEDAKDSATMITSAVATIAAIAMVAL